MWGYYSSKAFLFKRDKICEGKRMSINSYSYLSLWRTMSWNVHFDQTPKRNITTRSDAIMPMSYSRFIYSWLRKNISQHWETNFLNELICFSRSDPLEVTQWSIQVYAQIYEIYLTHEAMFRAREIMRVGVSNKE